jgi:hypothetical protein
MSVGLLVVRFQYGLYVVVHLSKFVTLFRVNSLLCRVVLRLLPTVCRLPQWGISEHLTVNQAQMLIEALHLN